MTSKSSYLRWLLTVTVGLVGGLAAPALAQTTTTPPAAATVASTANAGNASGEVFVTARKRVERLVDVPLAVSDLGPKQIAKYDITDVTLLSQQVPSLNAQFVSTGSGGAITIHGFGSYPDPGVAQAVSLNFDGIQVSRGRFLRDELYDIQDIEVLKGPQSLFYGKNSPAGVVAVTSAGPGSTWSGYATVGGSPNYGKEFVEAAYGGPVTDTLSIRGAIRLDHENGYLHNSSTATVDIFDCNPGATSTATCVHPISPGNIQGSTSPDYTSYFGRLTIDWHPNEAFTALAKASWGVYRDNGDVANGQLLCHAQHPTVNYVGISTVLTDSNCTLGTNETLGSWPAPIAAHWPGQNEGGKPFSFFDPFIGSLNMSYKLGQVTFTSITGFVYFNAVNEGVSSLATYAQESGSNDEQDHQYSEEIRAQSHFSGPFNFLAGFYYENTYRVYINGGHLFPGAGPFWVNTGAGIGYDGRNGWANDWLDYDPTHDVTYSPFAQATWRITDQLTLDAGARFLDETIASSVGNTFVNNSILPGLQAAVFSPEGFFVHNTTHSDNWSPEATLTYKPIRDLTFYVAYKSGFQSGGMSNPGLPGPGLTASNLTFKPMVANGEEFGIKWEAFQHTLRGDLTFYNYNFGNDQVQSGRLVTTPAGIQTVTYVISNAASATTQGIEFEGEWQTPLEGLVLNGFVNYNLAKYASYIDSPCASGTSAASPGPPSPSPECQTLTLNSTSTKLVAPGTPGSIQVAGVNLTGAPLPNAPLWTARLGFTYDHEIAQGVSFGLAFDANYQSSMYLAQPVYPFATLASHCVVQDQLCGQWIVDASVRVYTDDGKWVFALIGKNITNNIHPISLGTFLGAPTSGPLTGSELAAAINEPAELEFRLTRSFR